MDGKPFRGVHYVGQERQLYLAPVPIEGGSLILLTVFDQESSLGIVQLFFQEFCAFVAAVAPPASDGAVSLDDDFERELNRNLAVMFGRA